MFFSVDQSEYGQSICIWLTRIVGRKKFVEYLHDVDLGNHSHFYKILLEFQNLNVIL